RALPLGWAVIVGIFALIGLLLLGIAVWLWRFRPRLKQQTISFVLDSTRSTLQVYSCAISVPRTGDMIVDDQKLLISEAFGDADSLRHFHTPRVPSARLAKPGKFLPLPRKR